jgi:hypothetical protein
MRASESPGTNFACGLQLANDFVLTVNPGRKVSQKNMSREAYREIRPTAYRAARPVPGRMSTDQVLSNANIRTLHFGDPRYLSIIWSRQVEDGAIDYGLLAQMPQPD